MKRRYGFVSNSSSSSFIVKFPKKPETQEELKEMMGECHTLTSYSFRSTDQVVSRVWLDMQNKTPHLDSILFPNYDMDLNDDLYSYTEHLSDMFRDICNSKPYTDIEDGTVTEEMILREFIQLIETKIDEAKKGATEDSYTIKFNYSDEGSDGGLEHGDIFRNLEHEKISRH